MKRRIKAGAVFIVSVLVVAGYQSVLASSPGCQASDAFCYQPSAEKLINAIPAVTEPPMAVPAWLNRTGR